MDWLSHLPKHNSNAHKYDRGHLLVMGSCPSRTGASKLAIMAGLRIGAGVATMASPKESIPIYAASLTTPVLKEINNMREWRSLIKSKNNISAIVVGPNCGLESRTLEFTMVAVESGLPVVIDADAISVFSSEHLGGSEELFAAIKTSGKVVITPHEGEFNKLFPEITGSRDEKALAAAKISGAVMVLKGKETVIADPDGNLSTNKNAPPFLATAGSGDVLAGLIGGLLAQKMEPYHAAQAGCWVHAEAANLFGIGLIAEDLPGMIPKVLSSLSS